MFLPEDTRDRSACYHYAVEVLPLQIADFHIDRCWGIGRQSENWTQLISYCYRIFQRLNTSRCDRSTHKDIADHAHWSCVLREEHEEVTGISVTQRS